jgi:hypothetical protein
MLSNLEYVSTMILARVAHKISQNNYQTLDVPKATLLGHLCEFWQISIGEASDLLDLAKSYNIIRENNGFISLVNDSCFLATLNN